MRYPNTLYFRVFIYILIVLLGAILTVSGVAYLALRDTLSHQADGRIEETSKQIIRGIRIADESNKLKESITLIIGQFDNENVQIRIWEDESKHNISGNMHPEISAIELNKILVNHAKRSISVNENLTIDIPHPHDSFRVTWCLIPTQSGNIHIAVGVPASQIGKNLRSMHSILLLCVMIFCIISAWLASRIIRIALNPIKKTASQIEKLSLDKLDLDPRDFDEIPQELHPFRNVVVELISRINKVVKYEKQLINDASHELRTPLACAMSTIELAISLPPNHNKDRKAIIEVNEDLNRLNDLVGQLLTLARLEEIEQRSEVSGVYLLPIVMEVANDFKKIHGENEKYKISIDKKIIVYGSHSKLIQLFSNLLTNAIKHGPKNGMICVEAQIDCEWVKVNVIDQGGKISHSEIDRLFDRFYSINKSGSYIGSGLGLAICKKIVRQAGGQISIKSDPDIGTVVTVLLRPVK